MWNGRDRISRRVHDIRNRFKVFSRIIRRPVGHGCRRRATRLDARAAPNDYFHYCLISEQEPALSARCMCTERDIQFYFLDK